MRCSTSPFATAGLRRGSVLVYSLVGMTVLLGLSSLAVDYAHVQLVKAQMQRNADATARGALQMYVNDGSSVAYAVTPAMATDTYNPVDGLSGTPSTAVITWGWWNASTKAFVAGAGTPMAVQVVISRTAANGNPVPLTFPLVSGTSPVRRTCDVSARAVAVLTPAQTSSPSVPGKANIWLSGMPTGSTASYDDTATNAPPVLAMNVTPGAVITFTASGMTSNSGSTANIGPDGNGSFVTHMSGSPDGNYNGLQNGIQTLKAPLSSLIGVFITNAAPDTQTPPSTSRSYTSTTVNNVNYTDLKAQQPFFVGSGQNASGTTQSFIVPAGATRLYLGIFDTYENNNNPGSLSVGVTQQAKVTLMQ